MDALVMCGGRGTRLDADREKPLVRVAGVPMVDRVVDAVCGSDCDRVVAAVSPHTQATAAHLREREAVAVVETPGEGYVSDLLAALDHVETPALTVAADLPLLGPDVIDDVVAAADGSTTVHVPAVSKARLGVSVDSLAGDYDADAVGGSDGTVGGGDGPADEDRGSDGGDGAAGDDGGSDGGDETATPVSQSLPRTRVPADAWAPTGVNVVADDEDTVLRRWDTRLAVNVNRRRDLAVAAELLAAERADSG
ncbi:NTP transferase domain-containing protein [Halobaculum sp. MBLA0147]|uniref:NTP transferase domain-containing protein n=1 Tax=Halobaculum sp. MBLA0147 TaxID=3079934 RepID=UPI003524074E